MTTIKTSDPERALTTAEAADLLGVSKWKVRDLVRAGDLPTVRIGRSLRFARTDVLAFMQANTVTR